MNLFQLVPFFALVINGLTFIYIFARNHRSPLNRAFLAFSGLVGVWLLADLFHMQPISSNAAHISMRISSIAWVWVGIFYLNFIYHLIKKKVDSFIRIESALAILITIVSIFTDFMVAGVKKYYWGYNVKPGIIYQYVIWFIVVVPVLYGMYLTILEAKNEKSRMSVLWPIIVGTSMMLFTGLFADLVIPLYFGIHDFVSLASPSTVFLSLFLFISIIRNGLMSLDMEKIAIDMFNSFYDAVIVLDKNGKVEMFNKSATELTGNRIKSGMDASGLFKEYDFNDDFEDADTAMTGSDIPVSISQGSVISNGERLGKILHIRDLRKRQKLESEIIKRQKLESIGILAGGIAHDFNNILTAISSNISVIKQTVGSRSEILDILQDTENAAVEARYLTGQLLTFSRGGEPVREQFPVDRFIRDSVKFALRGSNVNAEINIPVDIFDVYADKSQLIQVINNLMINSIQAMPNGGVINICLENLDLEYGNTELLEPGYYIKISFEDQGCGIEPQNLNRVFDPYFSTKEQGSGLGLFSVYSIIQKHKGNIEVESTVGKGTVFTIILPARRPKFAESKVSNLNIQKPGARILIMDDEEMILKAASRALTKAGYIVATALDGDEAIKKYKQALDMRILFDVVVMDLTVPGKMGGAQCIKELLELDPDCRGIVSSGYSTDPVMARYRDYGFRAVAPKPYKISELVKIIEHVIEERMDSFIS